MTDLVPEGSGPQAIETEVAVAGGGVAGLAAAVAAARWGAEVYLIERYGFLGGSATAGLVGNFQTGPPVKEQPVIRGIFRELCDRLKKHGAIRKQKYGQKFEWGLEFSPEAMKLVAFDLCEDAGVHLLLHSLVYDVQVDHKKITSSLIATKRGSKRVRAQNYIDATGDGDLAAFAGAQFETGRPSDGLQQPMTLIFRLGNVDIDRLNSVDQKEISELFRKKVGVLTSRGKVFFYSTLARNEIDLVISHVAGLNGLAVEDLTQAEIIARRQALAVQQFFKKYVPGCEECILSTTATQIGVRETRRIIGEWTLTRAEVLGAAKFKDSIGCGTAWIDVHNPRGEGVLHEYVVKDDWYEIPYRCLVVKGFHNMLVAGRCVSATHEAQGAIRAMPACMVTGQGAGVAAALAASKKVSTRDLDIKELQKSLVLQGAWIGEHGA